MVFFAGGVFKMLKEFKHFYYLFRKDLKGQQALDLLQGTTAMAQKRNRKSRLLEKYTWCIFFFFFKYFKSRIIFFIYSWIFYERLKVVLIAFSVVAF